MKGVFMLSEFKKFVLRGNVVDLAVGVVVGAAFGAVVTSLVTGLITPLIAAIVGTPHFAKLHFTINKSTFQYGLVIDAIASFLLIAAAVFVFVMKPINMLMERRKTQPEVESPTRDCPECLSSIPAAAKRCAFCTAAVGPAPAPAA
jgi:large conductance mechanosensitive channel